MLYTIVGSGDVLTKDLTTTLESLWDAIDKKGEDEAFWLILPADDPGPGVTAIAEWAAESDCYFEVVTTDPDQLQAPFSKADVIHSARRVYAKLATLTSTRAREGEDSAMLAIVGAAGAEITDETVLNALYEVSMAGKKLYELPGMIEFGFSDEDDAVEPGNDAQDTEVDGEDPEVVADEIEIPKEADPELESTLAEEPEIEPAARAEPEPAHLLLTADDLGTLSREELKAIVKERGLVQADLRSKQSMIDAILAAQEGADVPEEGTTEPEETTHERLVREDEERAEAAAEDVKARAEADPVDTMDVGTSGDVPRFVVADRESTFEYADLSAQQVGGQVRLEFKPHEDAPRFVVADPESSFVLVVTTRAAERYEIALSPDEVEQLDRIQVGEQF